MTSSRVQFCKLFSISGTPYLIIDFAMKNNINSVMIKIFRVVAHSPHYITQRGDSNVFGGFGAKTGALIVRLSAHDEVHPTQFLSERVDKDIVSSIALKITIERS